jgi:anti-anti-sigma factor
MEVEIIQGGVAPIVAVSGEVDHSSASRLAEALEEAGSGRILLLDFGGLQYIDSGGLSVILRRMARLRPNGWVGIINASPNVMTLLSIVVAPGSSMRFFRDREEALNEASEPLPGFSAE